MAINEELLNWGDKKSFPLPKELIKKDLNTSILYIDEIRGGISKQVYKITTQLNKYILYI
ncbi:MAG: hypothetical protein PHY13_01135 [Clostridia bacterium]|nr:hypothetical protein [Clostridia bacterium]HXK71199.1 hypothetical protein [Clostridia bacterium]